MASAQVSSKPTKSQEHLEAGRRRLEEFRKKKGAKKSVATSQPRTTNSTPAEKPGSEHGPAPVDSAGSAYRMTDGVAATSGFPVNTGKEHDFTHDSGSETAQQAQVNFRSGTYGSPDLLPVLAKQVESEDSFYVQNSNHLIPTSETDNGDGKNEVTMSFGRHGGLQDESKIDFRSGYGGDKDLSSSVLLPKSNVSTKNLTATSDRRYTNVLHQYDESESVHPNNDSQASSVEDGHNKHGPTFKNYQTSDVSERSPSDAVGSLFDFGSQRGSEPLSEGLYFGATSPVNGLLSSAVETYSRKSRPSFLDSLNIGRDSPASERSFAEKDKSDTFKLPSRDLSVPSWAQNPTTSAPVEPLPTPVYSNSKINYFANGLMGESMSENRMESKLEFTSQTQNEDFAALEQHIEDLTQEKFSLQRAMEASRALAESLAAENSSLTESYNQQASNVSQLKAEMERLQGEIKARMVELEAIKAEYSNAHLECNAADERAKLLASEVINLEEKALRLRSNELRLERDLKNSSAEIASHKKKLSSLEKERRDLQQTIDALQEEKKLLQSKLRKASTSVISVDVDRGHAKKDASTSTNDLKNNPEETSSNIQIHEDTDNLLSLLENRSAAFEDVAMIIPPDQMQVIQNINSLITEIMSEKEEVMRALIDEVSTSAKLKDMNKELSHKLEVQTQRLELLTAQSMASENPPVRQPTNSRVVRETVAYADEGDEVVERVLGWIMKLFPGGPSKRRTSRL